LLPIKLYDSTVQTDIGSVAYKWNELRYKIGSDESERLAINEAKSSAATGDRSEYAATLNSHLNAVKMLRERLEILQAALKKTKVRKNAGLLRKINTIFN
jgi:cation transport regulator ChaC